MAKIITLRQTFMKSHPRAGEKTHFVEKVLNTLLDLKICTNFQSLVKLNQDKIDNPKCTLNIYDIMEFWEGLDKKLSNSHGQKLHTIRGGHRFKTGEKVQLAVWSGKPYCTPQIRICPELEVFCYDFETKNNNNIVSINGKLKWVDCMKEIATNDGLSWPDFRDWFQFPSDFSGQIIYWKMVVY